MPNDPTTSSEKMVREGDGSKSVLLFGFVSIALVAVVGATVDIKRLESARSQLQQQLDAALAAGAREGLGDRVEIAEEVFDSMATASIAKATDRRFSDDGEGISGTVVAAVPTTLSSMIGIRAIRVTAVGRAEPLSQRCSDPVIRDKDRAGCAITVRSSTEALPQP